MILGKMFPVCCYRTEATLRTRVALSLGMCPRGEVGAGVIVISLSFGIEGQAIAVAVMSLALNLVMSSGFIMAVKMLAEDEPPPQQQQQQQQQQPETTAGAVVTETTLELELDREAGA